MEKRVRFNINPDVHVKIGINYLDGRKLSQDEITEKYQEFLEEITFILADKETKFNRIVGLQTSNDEFWYLSTAADTGGQAYEELFFFQQKSVEDLMSNIKWGFEQLEKK